MPDSHSEAAEASVVYRKTRKLCSTSSRKAIKYAMMNPSEGFVALPHACEECREEKERGAEGVGLGGPGGGGRGCAGDEGSHACSQ